MERKRRRERERRAEITDAIDSLSETMVQIDPQINTTIITSTQQEGTGTGAGTGEQQGASIAGAVDPLVSSTSSATSIQRSLNRTDVIISARDMLVRQDNRIQSLEEALRRAQAGLPASAVTVDAHSPRTAAVASNTTRTSSTSGLVVASRAASNERLLNTRDIESRMNADSTTTANNIASEAGSILSYLSLQQQQQLQMQHHQQEQEQQQQRRRQEIELLNQMMSLAGNGQRIPSTYYNHTVSRDSDFNGSRDGVPSSTTGANGDNSSMFAAAAAAAAATGSNSAGGYASNSFVPRADSATRMNYGSINPALWYQHQQQQHQQQQFQQQEQQQPQQQEQQEQQQQQSQQQQQQQQQQK